MNTKFTKGPWRAEYDKVFHGRFVVAQCNAGVSVGINEMILRRNANAALIASAPELYVALEQIAALYIDDRSSSMHKALCIANKALKKARCEA